MEGKREIRREVNADYIDALEMYFLVRNKQGIGARSVEANTFEIKLKAKRWIKNGICFRER